MQPQTIAREVKDTATGIHYINHQQAREGYLYPEENALLFVCSGSFILQYGEAAFEVTTQQTVFLRKHILVRYQAIDRVKATAAFLLFVLQSTTVLEFIRSAQLQAVNRPSPEMVLVHRPGQQLLACLVSVGAYFINGVTLTEHLVKIKLLELLFCLPGSRQDQVMLEQVLNLREPFRGDIVNIIEENIMNTISLTQMARLAGRSLSSFRRDFQAIYNMPPSRWIRLKRLEKARELLAGTRMSVTDICYTLGFENIAHFSRLFKSHFGFSPSTLRSNTVILQLPPEA